MGSESAGLPTPVVSALVGVIVGFLLNDVTRSGATGSGTPVVSALVGVTVGFLLTFLKESQASQKQAQSVLSLLEVECDRNLQLLQRYQSDIRLSREGKEDPALVPLPVLSQKSYVSLLPLLASALKGEKEKLLLILAFYNQLDTFVAVHTKLVELGEMRRREIEAGNLAQLEQKGAPRFMLSQMHRSQGKFLSDLLDEQWNGFESDLQDLIQGGNPLK